MSNQTTTKIRRSKGDGTIFKKQQREMDRTLHKGKE